mmetsp:Transcript_3195/g.4677  ORF Transcript_3195/g.4677 Transcript_3195/m.4677 type:complete len:106 (-) Transcript_3195:214-531(-)
MMYFFSSTYFGQLHSFPVELNLETLAKRFYLEKCRVFSKFHFCAFFQGNRIWRNEKCTGRCQIKFLLEYDSFKKFLIAQPSKQRRILTFPQHFFLFWEQHRRRGV